MFDDFFFGISRAIRRPGFLAVLLMFLTSIVALVLQLRMGPQDGSILTRPAFLTSLGMLVLSLFMLLFTYLGGRSSESERVEIMQQEMRMMRDMMMHQSSRSSTRSEETLSQEIRDLKSSLGKFKGFELSAEDRASLFENIKTSVQGSISKEILDQVSDIYGSTILERTKNDALLADFEDIKQRLKTEIRILSRRANTNLAIGSSLTIVAGVTLWVTVVSDKVNVVEWLALSTHFIPRISLIIFIELFAFFFLKIYRSDLGNIRYYHNELTNIDLQILSLKSALISKDNKILESVINKLSQTERNFLIPKEHTTIELEKVKTDRTENKGLMELIKTLLKKD